MLTNNNKLLEICERKREHIKLCLRKVSLEDIMKQAYDSEKPRNFLQAIQDKVQNDKIALIAEIKKASPSRGIIREDFNPVEIATSYKKGGATCLSVLTDEPYFSGHDSYVALVKNVVDLPVLRKDFILEPYQIYESRTIGADCILLIMAVLDLERAKELEFQARDLGMDVLVEVHTEDEINQALELKTKLIGINNRDLKSLTVDLAITKNLAQYVPQTHTIICESGIYNHSDILTMNQHGIYGFLVGESLMKQNDIEIATRQLLGLI